MHIFLSSVTISGIAYFKFFFTFEKLMTISHTVIKLKSMHKNRSLWNYILYLFITRVTSDHIFSEAFTFHYAHEEDR